MSGFIRACLAARSAVSFPAIPMRLAIRARRGGVVILVATSHTSRRSLILSLCWCCRRASNPDLESLNTTEREGERSPCNRAACIAVSSVCMIEALSYNRMRAEWSKYVNEADIQPSDTEPSVK